MDVTDPEALVRLELSRPGQQASRQVHPCDPSTSPRQVPTGRAIAARQVQDPLAQEIFRKQGLRLGAPVPGELDVPVRDGVVARRCAAQHPAIVAGQSDQGAPVADP